MTVSNHKLIVQIAYPSEDAPSCMLESVFVLSYNHHLHMHVCTCNEKVNVKRPYYN